MQDQAAEDQKSADSVPAEAWLGVLGLTCTLTLELGIAGFKVRDLLALSSESVVDTHYNATAHVPVCVNGVRIGMAEFDVLQTRLAIRLSEVE